VEQQGYAAGRTQTKARRSLSSENTQIHQGHQIVPAVSRRSRGPEVSAGYHAERVPASRTRQSCMGALPCLITALSSTASVQLASETSWVKAPQWSLVGYRMYL